jgi:aspartate/methionine/tyrosine aminotransferase
MDDYDRPAFFQMMAYADAADRDVVDMVSGNPDWAAPEALREGLREYADAGVDAFQYPPSEGLLELREEIAARRGVDVRKTTSSSSAAHQNAPRSEDVERVVVTNGAGEANYLAMACGLRALDGDEVILTDPVYPYYYERTEMLEATPRLVAADPDGGLDAGAVREAASDDTALVVVNSPNNPTGGVYGRETKRELVAIAEEHDALLVSDEVYDHFVYEEGAFASAMEFDSERVAVTNAFSKSMAITGFRVGYAVLPEWLVDEARTRHMLVNVAGSRPAQYAVLKALRETPADYYEENRRLLASRIDAFCDALDEAGAEYTRPRGSFYVMARFEGYPGTLENAERLVDEAGVAGMPGDAFGRSRADWLRFALVTPRAEEAARRLAAHFA